MINTHSDIFTTPTQNSTFLNDGYLSMNFLSSEEVRRLREGLHMIAHQHHDQNVFHSYTSIDEDIMRRCDQFIRNNIPSLSKRLNLAGNFRIATAVYINKSPSKDSIIELHTDDSLCDERIHQQINIWIPLVNTNYDNGTFCICNSTHHKTPLLRADSSKFNFIRKNRNNLLNNFTPVIMNAGNALIYTPSIIHFSPPNTSQQHRPAIAIILISKEAEICIFKVKKDILGRKKLLKYALSDESFSTKIDLSKLKPNEVIKL